jgi:glutamate/tyrosine decarboxylase-like PLP-dependent enzyme
MLRDRIAWTAELAERAWAEPDFELTTPPKLALLTFRYVIRFAIGQFHTTHAHIERAWQVVTETARNLPVKLA